VNKFILEKLLSKKFIGWVGACVFLWFDKITSDTWMWITLGYMGIEAGINLLDRIGKCNGKENEYKQS